MTPEFRQAIYRYSAAQSEKLAATTNTGTTQQHLADSKSGKGNSTGSFGGSTSSTLDHIAPLTAWSPYDLEDDEDDSDSEKSGQAKVVRSIPFELQRLFVQLQVGLEEVVGVRNAKPSTLSLPPVQQGESGGNHSHHQIVWLGSDRKLSAT